MNEKCGCKIIVVPDKEELWEMATIMDNFVISFCPLHAAAEKLRDALPVIHDGEDGTWLQFGKHALIHIDRFLEGRGNILQDRLREWVNEVRSTHAAAKGTP